MLLQMNCIMKRAFQYHLEGEGVSKTSEELVDYYDYLIQKYPIVSIEDGLAEDDWPGWKMFTDRLGQGLKLLVMIYL